LPAPGAGINTVPALDQWALRSQKMYSLEKDDMPPALLYLAIRSARRALGINPADAQAHLILGESYLYLLRNTRERIWAARLKHLTQLRRVQASAALNQAILLQPNLAKAHRLLAGLYSDMGYLDLALKHFQAHRKLVPTSSQRSSPQQFQDQMAQFDLELNRLAEAVREREKKYAAAGGMRLSDRAMLANQLGLAGKARDLLLQSDVTAFGRIGMALELDLLLKTGGIKEVREWTGEDQKDMLGEVPFYLIRALALAASGDYRLSERELATLAIAWQGPVAPRTRMALEIAKAVLEEQPLTRGSWAYQVWRAPGRIDFRDRVLGLARRLRGETNAIVLRGLLALEEGEVDNARIAFRTALALWKDEASVASGAGLDFDARPIAQECLRWWD
jgi:tetratricopeptide (TPR) repeat protein